MRERREKPKRKRRIRWGRVFLFLLVLTLVGMALFWMAKGLASLGGGIYSSCVSAFSEYQKRVEFQAKIQDPRFADYTNILFIGTEDGDENDLTKPRKADAMFLLSLYKPDRAARILSIPPNTYVKIPGKGNPDFINAAYLHGGAQLAVRTVENVLEVPVHHYVVVDYQTFVRLVDMIGGVDLYVERDMEYEDPYASLKIHLKQGFQHLDGDLAGNYVRYRNDELGDIGRVQRQQKFLKALYQQILHMDMIVKVPELAELFNDRVLTSLAAFDAAKTARDIGGIKPEIFEMRMLPGTPVMLNGKEAWTVDKEKLQAVLNEMFHTRSETLPIPEN